MQTTARAVSGACCVLAQGCSPFYLPNHMQGLLPLSLCMCAGMPAAVSKRQTSVPARLPSSAQMRCSSAQPPRRASDVPRQGHQVRVSARACVQADDGVRGAASAHTAYVGLGMGIWVIGRAAFHDAPYQDASYHDASYHDVWRCAGWCRAAEPVCAGATLAPCCAQRGEA